MISAIGTANVGRWYCDSKTTVEQSTELSIFRLNAWGYLQGWRSGTLTWTRKLSGSRSSVGLVVDAKDSDPYARVYYVATDRRDGSKREYNYEIGLVTTPCNLGGVRYWFCCPRCGRRSGVLYLDNEQFVCRICANLTYQSRNESRMGRPGGMLYACVCDRQAREIRETVKRRTWRGRPTRKMRRIERLEARCCITRYPKCFGKYRDQF